jgi:hypothetical protein
MFSPKPMKWEIGQEKDHPISDSYFRLIKHTSAREGYAVSEVPNAVSVQSLSRRQAEHPKRPPDPVVGWPWQKPSDSDQSSRTKTPKILTNERPVDYARPTLVIEWHFALAERRSNRWMNQS